MMHIFTLCIPKKKDFSSQAMVHELIGIRNNTVDMTGRTSDADAATVLSLGSASDDFYRHNMYANFGEIGQTIQSLVSEFQQTVRGHQQIESIGDIKVRFAWYYPCCQSASWLYFCVLARKAVFGTLIETKACRTVEVAEPEK